MERFSCEIHIRTSLGQIHVEGPCQPDSEGLGHQARIVISPHQVDELIQWLQEAKAELLKSS